MCTWKGLILMTWLAFADLIDGSRGCKSYKASVAVFKRGGCNWLYTMHNDKCVHTCNVLRLIQKLAIAVKSSFAKAVKTTAWRWPTCWNLIDVFFSSSFTVIGIVANKCRLPSKRKGKLMLSVLPNFHYFKLAYVRKSL